MKKTYSQKRMNSGAKMAGGRDSLRRFAREQVRNPSFGGVQPPSLLSEGSNREVYQHFLEEAAVEVVAELAANRAGYMKAKLNATIASCSSRLPPEENSERGGLPRAHKRMELEPWRSLGYGKREAGNAVASYLATLVKRSIGTLLQVRNAIWKSLPKDDVLPPPNAKIFLPRSESVQTVLELLHRKKFSSSEKQTNGQDDDDDDSELVEQIVAVVTKEGRTRLEIFLSVLVEECVIVAGENKSKAGNGEHNQDITVIAMRVFLVITHICAEEVPATIRKGADCEQESQSTLPDNDPWSFQGFLLFLLSNHFFPVFLSLLGPVGQQERAALGNSGEVGVLHSVKNIVEVLVPPDAASTAAGKKIRTMLGLVCQ